jgi:hypothetical protein
MHDPTLFSSTVRKSLAEPVLPEQLVPPNFADALVLGWEWARLFWRLRTHLRAVEVDAALAAAWASGPSYEEGEHPTAFLGVFVQELADQAGMGSLEIARQVFDEAAIPWGRA